MGEETDVVGPICYKKRRKKYKPALFTQIAIQLNLFWLINTFPSWCIVNDEMDPLACVNSWLDRGGGALPRGGGRFAPCYSSTLYTNSIQSPPRHDNYAVIITNPLLGYVRADMIRLRRMV